MSDYHITFTQSARKELERLETKFVKKIFPRIEQLSENPRPKGCRKLQGKENLWRLRVGDYRIIYSTDDKEKLIDIIRIRHRKESYT